MKTILVPTDFSKLSKAAALYAAGLAKAIKAEVQIVSVVDLDSSSQTLVNWREAAAPTRAVGGTGSCPLDG